MKVTQRPFLDVQKCRDIASLRGVAGSLDQPLAWQQMQEIAYEDRLKENYDAE